MDLNESIAEANRLLAEAGWTPIPNPVWNGGYTVGTLVGGVTPDGRTQYVKDWAMVQEGDPRRSPDTSMDEPHEAAAWLIEHAKARAAPKPKRELSELAQRILAERALAPAPEAGQDSQVDRLDHRDGGDNVTGASASVDRDPEASVDTVDALAPLEVLEPQEIIEPSAPSEPEGSFIEIDADAEFPELEAPDLGAEILDAETEAAPGVAIFGDNLDQMRTAAIGLVIRHAKTLMPFWTTNEHAEMVELRNFVMGVSEKRWDDDPARRERLEELEATRRSINQIEDARDAKVEFLGAASRAEIEAFDVEADWPC